MNKSIHKLSNNQFITLFSLLRYPEKAYSRLSQIFLRWALDIQKHNGKKFIYILSLY
jgi:hypothetical protein